MRPPRAEYRAVFDVRIGFLNGGSLSADGFRLDIPSDHTSETEIARLLVQHLGNGGPPAQVHLRTEGCHVVENLTDLALLPASGSRFSAVPLTNASGDTLLVRAFAMTHTPSEEE